MGVTAEILESDEKCIDLAGDAREIVDYLIERGQYELAAKARDLVGTKDSDVWPKVRKCISDLVIHWSDSLRLWPETALVMSCRAIHVNHHANQDGVHGIRLSVTAEDGREYPRVEQLGVNYYLVLRSRIAIRIKSGGGDVRPGEVFANYYHGIPLPSGTVTTIDIFSGKVDVVSIEEPKPAFPYFIDIDGAWAVGGRNSLRIMAPNAADKGPHESQAGYVSVDGLKRLIAHIEAQETA